MLERLGIADAVLAKALRPKSLVMYDWMDGGVITRIPTGESFLQRFKKPYVVIHRVDLHQVLLDACRALPNVQMIAKHRGQVVRGSGRPRACRYRGRPALRGRGADRRGRHPFHHPPADAQRRAAALARLCRAPHHRADERRDVRCRPRQCGDVVGRRLPHRALSPARSQPVQRRHRVQDAGHGADRHRQPASGSCARLSRLASDHEEALGDDGSVAARLGLGRPRSDPALEQGARHAAR